MNFEEWWEKDKILTPSEKMAADMAWNAAMKEAARICREQIPPDADSDWSEACEYCATEIEQGG